MRQSWSEDLEGEDSHADETDKYLVQPALASLVVRRGSGIASLACLDRLASMEKSEARSNPILFRGAPSILPD